MKNFLGLLLVLTVISICFAGCKYFAPKHEHQYSPSYDETSHFQKCACGEIAEQAEHSLEWVIDKEPTATENGSKHLECGCGYKTDENTVLMAGENDDGTPMSTEMLIGQIKQNFNSNNEIIELVANPFSQNANDDLIISYNIKITDSEIYVNDILYSGIKITNNPKVKLDNETFAGVTGALWQIEYNEMLDIFEKIEQSDACYTLETEMDTDIGNKIDIYFVDGIYFCLTFGDNSDVARIHFVSVKKQTPEENEKLQIFLSEMFNIIRNDAEQNSKYKFSTLQEELHYELKDSGLYNDSEWETPLFYVYVICDYTVAINESWYIQCEQKNRSALNKALYDHCKSDFSNGEFSNSAITDGLLFIYSSSDNLYSDYESLKRLTENEYVTELSITYIFELPYDYMMGKR